MTKEYEEELKRGYLNEDGSIKLEFIDGFPQKLAQEFSQDTPALTTKQSREYFDTINKLLLNYELHKISFNEILAELCSLKATIYGRVNKGTVSSNFFNIFDKNIEAIKRTNKFESFRAFKFHFEAICNYLPKEASKTPQSNSKPPYNPSNKPQNNWNNQNKR